MKKIILLGYMGSGKSTIGKLLSNKVAIPHFDLDEIIEKRTHSSISELFSVKGELYFRKLEHAILEELMASPEAMIISLGGGTPCYANNHLWLQNEQVVSVYLKANLDTLFQRLLHDKKHRPILATLKEEERKEFMAKQLFERSYYYHHAQHVLNVDNQSEETLVSAIEKILA